MKKYQLRLFSLVMTLAFAFASFAPIAHASEIGTKDIPIGSSSQLPMIGTIEPTILSVTMPTYVPFNLSNSLTTQNKVISPRITMQNHSSIPVKIDVVQTMVDLSAMQETTWSDTGAVGPRQIAIGFKNEVQPNLMPADLSNTKWLAANKTQNINVMTISPDEEGAIYVVGTLGVLVTESASFHVTPTFVVNRALQAANNDSAH